MLQSRSLARTYLPILVLIEEIASIAPLLALMASGFDADDKVRSPFIPAMLVIGIVGFLLAQQVGDGNSSGRNGILVAGFGVAILAPWLSGVGPLWDSPVLAVSVLASFEAMLAWWRGITLAADPGALIPEELMSVVRRSWIVLAGSILIIAMLSGVDSGSAKDTAGIAIPTAAIAAIFLLAIGQMQRASTRSRETGGTPPDQRRWLRFTLGFAVIVVGISIVLSAAIGEETAHKILTPFALAIDGITWVLTYVFFGVAVVFLVIFYPIGWLIERTRPPEQEGQPAQGFQPIEQADKLRPGGESGPPHWLQLGGEITAVILIVAVAAFLLSRAMRKKKTVDIEDESEEEHESLWSRDLALNQLKGLFRRRGHGEQEVVDLRRTPVSVRDAYRSLLALAQRDGVPRRDDETPAEFAARLRGVWPALANDVSGLTREYELARYGEVEDAPADERARRHWSAIWASREAVVGEGSSER